MSPPRIDTPSPDEPLDPCGEVEWPMEGDTVLDVLKWMKRRWPERSPRPLAEFEELGRYLGGHKSRIHKRMYVVGRWMEWAFSMHSSTIQTRPFVENLTTDSPVTKEEATSILRSEGLPGTAGEFMDEYRKQAWFVMGTMTTAGLSPIYADLLNSLHASTVTLDRVNKIVDNALAREEAKDSPSVASVSRLLSVYSTLMFNVQGLVLSLTQLAKFPAENDGKVAKRLAKIGDAARRLTGSL